MKLLSSDTLKTPRGKLLAALAALFISWLFLLWHFSGALSGLLPDSDRISATENALRKLRQENRLLRDKEREIETLRKRYAERIATGWQESRDGAVETGLRSAIQQAAHELNLQLNSLGSVRVSRINPQFYYAEIDFSATAPLETIIKFFARIEEIRPVLSWRRFDLRPERMRPGSSGSDGNVTIPDLMFNGSIRVIGYDGEPATATGGRK